MKRNQLNQGAARRLMYVEAKTGDIDGAQARVGWVTFSRSGKSVNYRGRSLLRANGPSGNFIDVESREWFWVSGIKSRGSNVHPAERQLRVIVDDDAVDAYATARGIE